jgi:hypothetical protein
MHGKVFRMTNRSRLPVIIDAHQLTDDGSQPENARAKALMVAAARGAALGPGAPGIIKDADRPSREDQYRRRSSAPRLMIEVAHKRRAPRGQAQKSPNSMHSRINSPFEGCAETRLVSIEQV